jgi:starch synthase
MEKTKILFVEQEIIPYTTEESIMGTIGRYLPQGIQEKNNEIRTFMPRFGCINERRNQLHEVIRLSGMNIIINDMDHPLLIKVASIQPARMQVYFIDNEDYFQRKFVFNDKKNIFFKDNDERIIFYSRGVLETVKKLGWAPDIIHCHGWISSLVPLYVKTAFKVNPLFTDAKVIFSIYDDDFCGNFNKNFADKIKLEGIKDKDLKYYKNSDYINMIKSAIDFSDALIIGSEKINPEIKKYLSKINKPILDFQPIDTNDYIDTYHDFYDKVLEKELVV